MPRRVSLVVNTTALAHAWKYSLGAITVKKTKALESSQHHIIRLTFIGTLIK